LNLPNDAVEKLWECITMIEAQEQLKTFVASDWSNMKKNQRTKLHKDLYNQAYPSQLKKKNYITPEDLAKVLGR
jgi:hypothetical protein